MLGDDAAVLAPSKPHHAIEQAGTSRSTRRFASFLEILISTQVMERSSTLRGGHNIHTDQLATPAAALALTDAYDHLSDSPLPYEVVPLLLSHPGKLTAGLLLTLRDPVDWVRSRVEHHGTKKCCKCCSVSAPPCGTKEWINASRPDYLTYYGKLSFVYKAWVACLATSQSLGFDASNLYASTCSPGSRAISRIIFSPKGLSGPRPSRNGRIIARGRRTRHAWMMLCFLRGRRGPPSSQSLTLAAKRAYLSSGGRKTKLRASVCTLRTRSLGIPAESQKQSLSRRPPRRRRALLPRTSFEGEVASKKTVPPRRPRRCRPASFERMRPRCFFRGAARRAPPARPLPSPRRQIDAPHPRASFDAPLHAAVEGPLEPRERRQARRCGRRGRRSTR